MKKRVILFLALAFLFFSLIVLYFGTIFIYKIFPSLPVAADFLYNITPRVDILWLAELILGIGIISFLIFAFSKKNIKKIPFYATIIGIYSLLKAIFIYATPLGNPHPVPGVNLPFFPNGGMFPSGHIGTLFLFFLFTLDSKSKYWKVYFITLVILETAAMILSRGHYTIDIISALFISFGVWKIVKEHFSKNLILK